MRDGGQHRCIGTRTDLDKISIFRHNLVSRETRLLGIRLASWHVLGEIAKFWSLGHSTTSRTE